MSEESTGEPDKLNENDDTSKINIEELMAEHGRLVNEYIQLIKQVPSVVKEMASRGLEDAKKEIDDGISGKITSLKKARETLLQAKKSVAEATQKRVQKAQEIVSNNVQKVKNVPSTIKDKVVDIAETGALYGMEAKDKVTDVAETVALYGMEAKDKVTDVAETVALYGMEAKDKVTEVAETGTLYGMEAKGKIKSVIKAGKVALEIGKKTYRGTAFATALGKVAIEGASKNFQMGKEKVGKIAGEVKEGAIDYADGIYQLAEDNGILQASEKATNYVEMAGRKVALTKTKASIGIKSFIKNMAQKVVDKLGKSLGNDKETAKNLEFGIEENRNNLEELNNGKGPRMETGDDLEV